MVVINRLKLNHKIKEFQAFIYYFSIKKYYYLLTNFLKYKLY